MSSLDRLRTLVSPLGGLVGSVIKIPEIPGEPAFINYSGELGGLDTSTSERPSFYERRADYRRNRRRGR